MMRKIVLFFQYFTENIVQGTHKFMLRALFYALFAYLMHSQIAVTTLVLMYLDLFVTLLLAATKSLHLVMNWQVHENRKNGITPVYEPSILDNLVEFFVKILSKFDKKQPTK